MARPSISFDDKYFKSDEIVHGRIIKRFLEELMRNVYSKSYLSWKTQLEMSNHHELPLLFKERNLYSMFASAIDEITPVHLSEWSFNASDTEQDDSRRVDFWCLNKDGENGKVLNYFIEIKKNYYCVSAGTGKDFCDTSKKAIADIGKQLKNLKKIRPNWGGDGDVYLGIIVTHAYYADNKKVGYSADDVRDNIYDLLDGRMNAQLLFSKWELPKEIKIKDHWDTDQCSFISMAGITITKSRM